MLEQDTVRVAKFGSCGREESMVSKGLFVGNNHTRGFSQTKGEARRGRAARSKLVSDKWSHIPWVRGSRYGMVHGSGVFSTHRIQEVSMPFGPEEGLSKPSTRIIFPERPKARQRAQGETRNNQWAKCWPETKVFAASGPNVENCLCSH